MATDAQVEFIEDLLDAASLDLSDYTTTALEDLTKEEASDIIDSIKEDLGYV